jgi:glycosyltransferase involved in cell wall biosynthesis
MPSATVIIPAYNAARTLGATLEGLARQDFEGKFEVIVVDDGSSDGTAAIAQAADLRPRLLRQDQLGPGAARNRGAREARSDILAFTDSDCVPTEGWLRCGIDALEKAHLVQGAVRPDPGTRRTPFDRSLWVTAESGLYECASLFIRRELFERVGGFEDWLGARLGKELAEDAWLGWRARRAGAITGFSRHALVHHSVFPRSPVGYVTERMRLVYFPAIARRIPELRRHMFFGRVFLNRRSAAFDLAVTCGLAAGFGGNRPLLVGIAPYGWMLARRSRRWGFRAAAVAPVDACADLVGLGAMLIGSARYGALVV